MIKIIAFDMDGTLLNHQEEITSETKRCLLALQKRGMILVLASGRSYSRLLRYAHELQMDIYGGYLIEVNGMAIYDVKKCERTIYGQLNITQAQALFNYFKQWKVEIIGHFDTGMFDYNPEVIWEEKRIWRLEHKVAADVPWTGGTFSFIGDTRNGYPNIHYVQSFDDLEASINKISITYWPDQINEVYIQAKKDLKDHYWIGLTSPKWLEIMPLGITKANTLALLAEQLHIENAEIMAFGDGENDIEMLVLSGVGIAMGNAFPSVKIIADDVTESNEEEGIAKAIHKYFSF